MERELELQCTTVFERNWEAINSDCRYIRNEGGSRSSKTWSLCQCVILYCYNNPDKMVSIIRKTGPALTATVIRDLLTVLKEMNIYEPKNHKRGSNMYIFDNGSIIEWFSLDDEQKIRGRKRDLAWINEANEIGWDDFNQLALRTTDKLIVDYNPSAVQSFLYDLPEDMTVSIHSTYKDNPTLPKTIIEQIESYKETDPDYYTIFCLGKRCFSKENVYSEWKTGVRHKKFKYFVYGIDFGYTHPTALVKIWYDPWGKDVFIEELIHESYLSTSDLVNRMSLLGIEKGAYMVSETASPMVLSDLKKEGYRIVNADKTVREGIMNVKMFDITLDVTAKNLIMENQSYRFRKRNGIVTEDVIKMYDDGLDAIRYGLLYIKMHLLKGNGSPKISVFKF